MSEPRIVHIDGHEYRVQTPLKNAVHSGHYIDVFSGTRELCQAYAGQRGWPTAVEGGPRKAKEAPLAEAPAEPKRVTPAAQALAEERGLDPQTAEPHPGSGVIGVPQIHAALKEQGK